MKCGCNALFESANKVFYLIGKTSGVAKGGGPPLAALLWGRHYGLCCGL